MPSDFITLNALANELNCLLKNGKIDKIYMPEKDEITLQIRSQGATHLLAISCNASNPRIHLTASKKENPQAAPSFCMHLRKHLTGGIISNIKMLGEDRIVCLEIVAHNEMRDEVAYQLVAEMMGRYSNILVVNNKNIITDTLKQANYDEVTKRCILPSAQYILPEQSKILPSNAIEISKILSQFSVEKDGNISKFLMSNIAGLSLQSALQIVNSTGLNDDLSQQSLNDIIANQSDCGQLSCDNISAIIAQLQHLLVIFDTKEFCPCVAQFCGKTQDYFVAKYIGATDIVEMPTLNEAIAQCVSKKDENSRQEEHTRHLQKALNAIVVRNQKKLAKANEKLAQTENMDNLKLCGDLITANMYMIKKGQTFAELPNYYDENSATQKVELNAQLSPAQNAQDYFKRYAKQKRTKDIVSKQVVEIADLIEYLLSIKTSLTLCKTQIEINELTGELQNIGAIKKPKNLKNNKIKPAQPITYEVNDFVVCVGKNNIQNDKLTFKLANGNDLWLHTKSHHGSHTIVFAEARDIPNNVIQIAAEIAAFYSQGNTAPKVEVDYTCRKNVKRHPSGQLGMVTYSDFQTAFVTPLQHLEFLDKA